MKKPLALLLVFFCLFSLKASHNRGGEILYKRIAPFASGVGSSTIQVYTYSITVIKYTDHGPNIAERCMDTVYFGDGQKGAALRVNGIASGTCNCNSIPCGEIILNTNGYIVKKNVYSIIHTYSGPGSYLIKSSDPNRNGGIRNIPNSINIPFYIESQMIITASTGSNTSPVFSNPPTDRVILGNCTEINVCAFDADGDSLSYELSTCKNENGQTISGYFLPEIAVGGSFNLDGSTGLLTWCTPQFVDEYSIAVLVKEWRKTSCTGTYQLLGYVFRDFQTIVISGTPASFSTSTLSDMCVKAGFNAVKGITVNSNGVTIQVLGETKIAASPSQISPVSVSGNSVTTFSWVTSCSEARKKAYDVYLVYSSNGMYPQKFYRQFKVTVLPPSPTIVSTVVDTGKVTLSWNTCMTNAAGFNIYRKSGSTSWTPSSCEQGVSLASGFVLVGVASSTATSFTDTNVWPILNGTTAHYIVTAFTQDCAESSADNAQTVTLIVGIEENSLLKTINVYPNPFSEKMELDLSQIKGNQAEISFFSHDGKLVSNEQYQTVSGKLVLNTAPLKAGLYLLKIRTESGITYRKIVKE